ncbi:MAG: hypothetical protein BGO82_05955 [Devosia sp. 67-54]|uniref:hypothetical protein n=1 Tax=unclassified Devosia TaxID=196773 RepID=UPI00095ED06E|nr:MULTISPECIES: hypothetical protein [unclassified Devosia]MBN9306838.1 hypothetical protein [Devosia sp.]OJX17056.1 MAG: hypothetical protein BGO82_05955 [Devosia sp. 67-54]
MSSFNLPAARIAAAKSKAAQYIDLAAKCDALIASLLDLVGEVEALERAADDDLRGGVDDRGEQAPRFGSHTGRLSSAFRLRVARVASVHGTVEPDELVQIAQRAVHAVQDMSA